MTLYWKPNINSVTANAYYVKNSVSTNERHFYTSSYTIDYVMPVAQRKTGTPSRIKSVAKFAKLVFRAQLQETVNKDQQNLLPKIIFQSASIATVCYLKVLSEFGYAPNAYHPSR